MIKTVKCK